VNRDIINSAKMFSKIIDILTVIAMVIVLIVLILELTPVYKDMQNIFSANIYAF